MYSGKSKAGSAPAQLHMLIEEERPRGRPVVDGQSSDCPIVAMILRHAVEIDGTDHIYVMQQERFCVVAEKPARLLQSSTGIEQRLFAGNLNVHPKVVVCFQVLNNHVREVMDIDDHSIDTACAQTLKSDLQQRAACDFHQCLRTAVGEWPEARSKTCSQHHRFHFPRLSRARCRTTTSSPGLPRKCLASCSAKYTDRCCPPVQPNETIRFLKPRF